MAAAYTGIYGSEGLGAADSRATALRFGWIVLGGRCQ